MALPPVLPDGPERSHGRQPRLCAGAPPPRDERATALAGGRDNRPQALAGCRPTRRNYRRQWVAGTLFAGLAVGDQIRTGGFAGAPAPRLQIAPPYQPHPMPL